MTTLAGRAAALAARLSNNIGAKLFALLFLVLLLSLGVLGYLMIRLHRSSLEQATLAAADRVSDVVVRSTTYHMMRNDREALYHTIKTIGDEPGMVHLRIFNQDGRISFSTDKKEINRFVDQGAEACYGCHAQSEPLTHLDRPDRFRIFKLGNERVLGIINPIPNSPTCSSAACHAHPPEQNILGVLDTTMTLASADASLAQSSRTMLLYAIVTAIAISMLAGLFVWRLVHSPVARLKRATDRIAAGELGVQIPVESSDQIGRLSASFNTMSTELLDARDEITAWTRTLEARVEQKTAELRRADEQMLHAEKLTSLGKMAAVVAHEINNPLSGILTYARLMRKWIERGDAMDKHAGEMRESLQLIESESRRCGEIVKNLLTFARAVPMNLNRVDVNGVVKQTLRLIDHKLELGNIALVLRLSPRKALVQGDAAQLEQLILALVMNAIEAMPREGILTVSTENAESSVILTIEDDGIGIPDDVLAHLFEPFVTTKENHGVGLGLAISRRVVERHRGTIDVASEPGRGTRFTITLPQYEGEVSGESFGEPEYALQEEPL
jgi:two-component system, NtrC family, sensor kinase